MCKKLIYLISFVLVLGLAVPAFGALTLENASFENPALTDGSWLDGTPPGWDGSGGSSGLQDLTTGALNPPAIDGENCGQMNQGGWMYQVPQDGSSNVTVQPNQTYRVSLWVGRRAGTEGNYGGILQVSLQDAASSTTIAQVIYDLDPQPKNSWVYKTFYLTTGPSPAGIGSDLRLRFQNIGNRAPQFWLAQIEMDVVSIVSVPGIAINPSPADGSMLYSTNVSLQWQAGTYAAKHDVYLDTDFTDVNNATEGSHPGVTYYSYRQDANSYSATGLTPGATYYWRIDEVNVGTPGSAWKGDVWSFSVQSLKAYNPSPPNDANYVDPNADLSWSAGVKAKFHDVYFGTTHPLPRVSYQQPGTTYDPGKMAFNTLYYWRIDEVNGSSTWTGDEWQFRTIPSIPITDPNLVGWWKLDDGGGRVALDSSGRGNHGTLFGETNWVAGEMGGALEFNGSQDNFVNCGNAASLNITGRITLSAWVRTNDAGNSENNPYITKGNTSYALRHNTANNIEFFAGATAVFPMDSLFNGEWHHLAGTYDGSNIKLYVDGALRATTPYTGSIATDTFPVTIGADAEQTWCWYNGVVDDVRIYNRALTQAEIIVYPPEAWLPNPANGATDVESTLTLTWKPGNKAGKHDVYFSSNFDDVNIATTLSPATIYKGRQDPNKYDITTELVWGQTYYWRVDEVNDPNIWPGSVWSFTVRNFLVVDDFESYTNSDPNIIFKIWKDGVGYSPGNGTGSQVGYRDPNYAEVTIVNGGAQSMPLDYNNTKTPYYSEASRTFDTPQNWTAYGPYSLKALSLWFRGYPASVGSFNSSTYTITASGADIWDVPDLRHPSRFHDEFHYAYKEVTAADEEEGLVTIVARVESITNTNAWAKAGVMIRHSLDPNSTHGIMCVSPTSGVAFQRRPETGGASSSTATTGITAPYWVKIVLDPVFGNLRAYHSPTGNTDEWTQMGDTQQITNMTLPVYVGLAVTSHNAAATCTAVFSNVTITVGAAGAWKHQDIGIKSNIASPLYVTLQDSKTPTPGTKTITHSDPNILLQNTWQVWDIPLSDFTGVDPTKIKKITIGVGSGSADGTGTIYVDDIRLYVPRCAPDLLRSAADFTGSDCTVDYQDLAILTDNWAISDWLVTPPVGWIPNSDPNLEAYYTFEGNFNDSSNGYNGEPNGATIVTDSVRGGQVANFDGSNDYVVLTNLGSLISSMSSTTIATWVNFSNTGGTWQRIFDFGTGTNVYMFLTPRVGTDGVMRFAITTGSAGAESQLNAPSTLATGWHHVAVVINGASMTMQLYLDGSAVVNGWTPTQLLPSNLGNTTQNWLGRSQWSGDAYFSGRLDEFRIYSRVLSQGEVAYLAGKTVPFNQALYLLLRPADPAINLYNDGVIDLRDYAGLADMWLEKLLWP